MVVQPVVNVGTLPVLALKVET